MRHVDAALVALAADPLIHVYDGEPPSAAPLPYVVVYASVGRLSSDRLSAVPNVDSPDLQATVVGGSAEACRILGRRVRAVLLGRLPLADRQTWRGEHLDSQPIRRDDDIQDRVVFYGVDRYRLTST